MNLHTKRKRDIMKGKKLLVTLAVSAILFTGCGFKGGNTVIRVNDTKITQGQFDKELNRQMGNSLFAQMGVDLKNNKNTFLINIIKVRVVNDLITKALLNEEMKSRGIKISNKDVDDAIKDIITKLGSKEKLNQILSQNGMSMADFKEGIKEQVKIKKLANQLGDTTTSDADAKKFYNENIQRFKYPEQVRASHILIAANRKDLEELVKAENEGKELSEADLKAKVDVKIKENESVMGSTAMTYDLSEEKLMKLKYKSQHGDSEASFRLYQYYCFTKNNIDKQLRFLERSASQGNVTAQFNYGVFLSDTNPTLSEYYNLNRAIYWMEFAVNNGNIDAKSKLQELKKLKRMDRRKNKENP